MTKEDLIAALTGPLPSVLAKDLAETFILLRQDVSSGTLGRASPGKFVETVVQCLQHLESGQFQTQPDVDKYLRELDSKPSKLHDGLRLCASRAARTMYTLRNKRNILHKGDIDPNGYDLRLLFHLAQWILAELLRSVSGKTMQDTGKLIDAIQAPAGALIEDFGGKRLVLAEMSAREETALVLQSRHPESIPLAAITEDMDRRSPDTVRKTLKEMWSAKLVEGDAKKGYRLTAKGMVEAQTLFAKYG